MKLSDGTVYGRHDYPTVEINESELSDWPGYVGVLRIKIIKDNGDDPRPSKAAFFHVTASIQRGRPKVSVEDSSGKKKTCVGTFKSSSFSEE